MSLLDELKRKAQQVQEADSESQERLKREALYEERFKRPMLSILRYLSELTEQLKILDYEVRHDYTLPGIGVVNGLRHINYVVNADSSDNPKTIRLRFSCQADKETEYAVLPKPKADETCAFLDSQKMRYTEWPVRDHEQRIIGLHFQLRTEVKVHFIFNVDQDIGSIKLLMVNFNGFKLDKSIIQPELVNDTWLDNLGNFLVRKRVDLYDLDIDESYKVAIRKKLERDKHRREEELKQAIENEQAEFDEANRRTLLGRLKNFAMRSER